MTVLHEISEARSVIKTNVVAQYPLPSFFILAIFITWLLALPSLFFEMPFKPFQTAGAYGPLLAAVIVSAVVGSADLKSLFARMTKLRFGLRWYLIAIFGNLLLYLLVAGLAGAPLMQSLAEKWTLIFSLYLPALFTSYLVNPIGEETGWTGFALPRLQQRFRPWLAAVILGVIWAIWHLPAFFVPSEMGAFSPVNFIFFMLSSIFIRIVWTWVTNNAHGSGIAGILLHASSNAVSFALIPGLLPTPTPDQMAVSGLLLLGFMFLLSVVLLLFTRGQLSYRER
ncbi:MAG TPA: type II CAAX endopeptidase family protein [Anaerolineales bacterium]|nr:type II CAAX endopeptidase family protein [Anaerolineales bacterium]